MDMKFLIDWKNFSFNNNNNNNNNDNNKRYLRLLKQKTSEKLVDEESKVVFDN